MKEACFKINDSVVEYERVNGEVIVISFKSGKYFSLSGSAADIWTILEASNSIISLQQQIGKYWKLERDIKEELEEFINECINEEIVINSEAIFVDNGNLPEDQDRSIWHKPNLMIFGNLQDLIMVDPVHDASLINWPIQKDFEFDR